MKERASLTTIVGGVVFLIGLVRFNSAESHIVRALGGNDALGVTLLVVGVLVAAVGVLLAFDTAPAQGGGGARTAKCPKCGQNNRSETNYCIECGHALTELVCIECGHALTELAPGGASASQPEIVKSPAALGGSDIDQLERLAVLKERGLLTDEEFQLQKKKILV